LALVYKALRMATENPGCLGLLGVPILPMLRSVTIQAMLETLKRTAPILFRTQVGSLLLKRSGSPILFRPEQLKLWSGLKKELRLESALEYTAEPDIV
jgi:hypothetical protein